jgi:ABC-type uncharacterized transport system ATPase subunit
MKRFINISLRVERNRILGALGASIAGFVTLLSLLQFFVLSVGRK